VTKPDDFTGLACGPRQTRVAEAEVVFQSAKVAAATGSARDDEIDHLAERRLRLAAQSAISCG
jgi:hypothetical protein